MTTQADPIAQLLARGRSQGFVTFDDILELMPQVEDNLDQLEELFECLEEAGVPLRPDQPVDSAAAAQTAEEEPDGNGDGGFEISDTVTLYLREVSRIPLLTAEQEVALAQRIERGNLARQQLANDGRGLSRRRRRALQEAIADGEAAMRHLVQSNSRLVISMAKRYVNQGVPFLDLIQEGNLGLMKAAQKFDWRRGHKFSTYATWWVRQAITRALADQGRTIRVPVHMSDRIRRLYQCSRRLEQELGREPTVAELASALGTSPEHVQRVMQTARRPLSLEKPVGEEQESELGEFVEDEHIGQLSDQVVQDFLREDIERALTGLSQREQRILELRYGLHDGHAYTLKEVGEKFGLTRERIRQIENEALARLREPRRAQLLVDYLT